ncbi:MAG: 3-hydroxybutyrate dehydrogenase [Candidatus Velthaea sp.]
MLGFDLTHRVSIVTGGARGIGRACAEALAQAGASIALLDVDVRDAQTTAQNIAAAQGVTARGYACDVRDAAALRTVVETVAGDFGGVDHLVNNAGVQYVSPIAEFPGDKYELVRGVDLDGVFYATQAVWPHLVHRGGGRIVNIASVQGLIGSPFKAAYCAAKHGVVGLTKVTAIEGAALGITVNAICPGAVMTDLVRNQAAGLAQSFGGGISEEEALERAFLEAMPTRRFIEPAEVGALCAYLCSDFAKSITGAPISIDGGWSAH